MDPIKTEIVVCGEDRADTPRRSMRRTWARRSFSVRRETRLGGVCLSRGCIPSTSACVVCAPRCRATGR